MVEMNQETVACTVCDWTENVEEAQDPQESPDEMAPVGG
jgi:hypothetical protein